MIEGERENEGGREREREGDHSPLRMGVRRNLLPMGLWARELDLSPSTIINHVIPDTGRQTWTQI